MPEPTPEPPTMRKKRRDVSHPRRRRRGLGLGLGLGLAGSPAAVASEGGVLMRQLGLLLLAFFGIAAASTAAPPRPPLLLRHRRHCCPGFLKAARVGESLGSSRSRTRRRASQERRGRSVLGRSDRRGSSTIASDNSVFLSPASPSEEEGLRLRYEPSRGEEWGIPASSTLSTRTTSTTPSFVRWNTRTTTRRPPPPDDGTSSSSSSSSTEWCLDTAVVTYERKNEAGGGDKEDDERHTTVLTTTATRVDLHSVVHLAEAAYYDALNRDLLSGKETYDAVVYELLVDEGLLVLGASRIDNEDNSSTTAAAAAGASTDSALKRVLQGPVGASPSDRALAESYGLVCQADRIQYMSCRFVHGDLTRQELDQYLQRRREMAMPSERHGPESPLPPILSPLASLLSVLRRQQLYQEQRKSSRTPLWQQANRWSPTKEAATALWAGPPILLRQQPLRSPRKPSSNDGFRQAVQRRAIRWFLRPVLWLTVPSPEIPILLLDWSALGVNADTPGIATSFPSPVSRAVLAALASGNWDAARKLAFGQVLLLASSTSSTHSTSVSSPAMDPLPAAGSRTVPDDPDEWIQVRNQRAMEVLDHVMQEPRTAQPSKSSSNIALLYGCLHGPDLHARLVGRGFEPVEIKWRTAWSVPVQALTATRLLDAKVLQLLAVLVLYLGLGGLDWIATVGDVTHVAADFVRDASSLEESATAAASSSSPYSPLPSVLVDYGLYLVRHLFLYVGLSKFIWSAKAEDS